MGLLFNFDDIFEASSKVEKFSLPTYKRNPLEIKFSQTDSITTEYVGQEPSLPFVGSEVIHADLINWKRLTAENDACKSVYEISLDIKDSKWKFKPGYSIGIIPYNDYTEVNSIIQHLNLSSQADSQYILNNDLGGKIPAHIPVKSSLRHVLTSCCDIRCVLKKLFILALSRYTKDENERQALEYLCSKEGSRAYTTQVLNKRLNLPDLFAIFKSCKPPIEVLLTYLQRLLPRPYSIVNGGLNNSKEIKICFSVMKLENNKKGLVTGWLEKLILNQKMTVEDKLQSLNINSIVGKDKIQIYLRKNMNCFYPPDDLKIPLILIGPGSGVAPYIGFLEDRQYLKTVDTERNVGHVWLFFGCRNPELDYIYKEELDLFINNYILTRINTSFSRIENNKNKYIQDALLDNGEDIVKFIKEGAILFICGDLKNMAISVKEILVDCLIKYDSKSKQEAEKFLCDMQTEKRYIVDMWS